jgi:malonyl-CoA/methylmalonyl-CoA synthetase
MTLLDLFDGALADRAAYPAYGTVSYEDLHAGARRVATKLSELDLRRGDRLALYVENRIGFVYAYLAGLRLGLVLVPVNILYRSHDLAHVLENSEAARIVVSAQTAPHVAGVEHVPPAIDVADIERWATDPAIPQATPPKPGPDDVAVIMYTSGTTGRSKGAMQTHASFGAIAAQLVASWRWRADDTLLIALPLFHMHGLGAALNGTLAAGSRLVVDERFDAERILDQLRSGEFTMFFGVPTMYVRLLEHHAEPALPPIRLFVSGSAALSADVYFAFEQTFGARILERYGATEFGFVLGNRYGGPRVAGSVGVPMPGVRVAIVEPETLERVALGEVGELLVESPGAFAGYWNLPDATAAAFATDPDGTCWYRSGDLARYDAENDVYRIVGRLKELIISGGFNVYPLEIEDEIVRYPGVRAAAVVGMPDPARGELPVAFVEAEAGFSGEALVADLREKLASFKVPKAVYLIDELPRNALGKIVKARLRAPAATP